MIHLPKDRGQEGSFVILSVGCAVERQKCERPRVYEIKSVLGMLELHKTVGCKEWSNTLTSGNIDLNATIGRFVLR